MSRHSNGPIPPPGLNPLMDFEVGLTLGEDLVQTADDIRQLYTDFGLRPYKIFQVWIGWTLDENDDGVVSGVELLLGEVEVGAGRPVLLCERELLPTPAIQVGGVSKRLDVTGDTESGGLLVTQISPRFSEDELVGLVYPYRDEARPNTLKAGIDFFYEVRENRPPGFVDPGYQGFQPPQELQPTRRRFRVNQAPSRETDAFQWTLGLERADGERSRDGNTAGMDGSTEKVVGTPAQLESARMLVDEDDDL